MRAVIVDWNRSPFAKAHRGGLADVRPDEMAGQVARTLLERNSIEPALIDDILVGCAYPEGEQGYNIGRIITYLGGLPNSVPGATFNRLCGSSMQSILTAASYIMSGWGGCFLCGGVESMSRVMRRGFNWSPHPELESSYPQAYVDMGITAENVADLHGISREEQERFALTSHQKATEALQAGYFNDELAPISKPDGEVHKDECVRPETSLESMSLLPPAFIEGGSVTAATSSPLTDGTAFALVCSEEFALANGLAPIAAIVAGAVTGCPPDLMGLGPISATELVLQRAGWEIPDVDLFELNEAFSSQSIVCVKQLGLDPQLVNLDGGAIAIGHPLGASGARITCKAASLLTRTGGQRAIATMCIGGGMGIATALERV
ncbi:MAG: thiolase family protein [Candidatus Thermoplasmatota archaeon]|nr:thiolase family protein [Candidatus Thermoplasmatota archaeon]MEE2650338.1 thiolase family protein [Candidatus Thermoplasmatota archaeon]